MSKKKNEQNIKEETRDCFQTTEWKCCNFNQRINFVQKYFAREGFADAFLSEKKIKKTNGATNTNIFVAFSFDSSYKMKRKKLIENRRKEMTRIALLSNVDWSVVISL